MHASVPELTSRTLSTDGSASHIIRASSTSPSGGSAEAGPVARGLPQRLDHRRVGMAQGQRPPRADVVDILVAVHVPDPAALSPRNERRRSLNRPERPHRAVDSTGDVLLGLRK